MPVRTRCMTCKKRLTISTTFSEESTKMRCDDCQRDYEYARDNDL